MNKIKKIGYPMVLVFKLALLATTETAFCLNDRSESFASPREVATFAAQKLQNGNLSAAEDIFSSHFQKFSNNTMFQYEYISFMLKTGQYDKILNLKVSSDTNKKLIEDAKNYKKIIDSKVIKDICTLISISPISLDVNLAMIQSLLLDKKIGQADNYVKFAIKYYPYSEDLIFYKSYILLSYGNLDESITYLKHLNLLHYRKVIEILNKFKEYSLIKDPSIKMQYLLHLYREIFLSKMNSSASINIFDPIYKLIIEMIVKIGCDNQMKVASFANVLKEMDPTPENLVYYIKSLIFENRFEEAKKEIDNAKFNEAIGRYIDSFYKLKYNGFEKQNQERRRREEQRREQQRREQEQRNNFGGFQTKNAGKDFLNYYKILGVDKTVKPEALKKAHRKKVKEVNKKAAKKCKLSDNKNEDELKMINKAFQILSDPQKKQTYDMGIDPETGPQQPSHNSYGGRHDTFIFDEDVINDVFKTFFGGGQTQRGGRSYQRAQYIFL